MIPAHPNHGHVVTFGLDVKPPRQTSLDVPVVAWDDDGTPLVAVPFAQALRRPSDVTRIYGADVTCWHIEAGVGHAPGVVPGDGWMARFTEPDGDTLDEPVVAWQIDPTGDGRAILLNSEGFVTEHDTRSLEGRDLPTFWHPEHRPLPAGVTL